MKLSYQQRIAVEDGTARVLARGVCKLMVPVDKDTGTSSVIFDFGDSSISFSLEEFRQVANYVLYRKRVVRKKYKDNVIPFPGELK